MSIVIKHPGRLHRKLGVASGKKIPHAALIRAAHSPNKALRKEAQFAINAKKWHH